MPYCYHFLLFLITTTCFHNILVISKTIRTKRYFVFPPPNGLAPTKVQLILGLGLPMEADVSMIIGYVMKFNYALPYNATYLMSPYVRYDRSIDHDVGIGGNDVFDLNTAERTPVTNRWEFYEILQSILGASESGKPCLLRTICEVSDVSFDWTHGIFSQLLHIIFTPSTTSEAFERDCDREYLAAEIAGQENPGQCARLYSECSNSFLDYFTQVVD